LLLLPFLLPTSPAAAARPAFGNGDTTLPPIQSEVASTQVAYNCATPTPASDPNCNNFPMRFDVTDDFTTIYIALTTDPVQAPDLDLYLYDAHGKVLGSSARTGSAERAVIRVDHPFATDAVLVVQPYIAVAGTPFTLDVRVKSSRAVPAPITTS
jgi:hypothetical protein